ncbi:MAG: hypothetical protein AVDCRST_MAG26-1843, partial [uncultured Chloroflexia bacterium]
LVLRPKRDRRPGTPQSAQEGVAFAAKRCRGHMTRQVSRTFNRAAFPGNQHLAGVEVGAGEARPPALLGSKRQG